VAPALTIQLIGQFAVLRDGVPVALPPSKKTKALLAYLALAERPQRREFLCDMFWDVPDDPRGALRWSLSKIRQVLDDEDRKCITADRQSIELRREAVAIDAASLKRIKPSEVVKRSTAELEAIAATIHGAFLEDLSLPRCLEYEAWRSAHASEFETLRLATLRILVERLTTDDPGRALEYAHTLKRLNPEDGSLVSVIKSLTAAVRERHVTAFPPETGSERRPSDAPAAQSSALATPPRPGTSTVDTGGDSAPIAERASAPKQDIRYCLTPDGVRLAYATVGEGPVMVRAPHWMTHLEYDCDSPIWRPWIEELSRSYRLIRFDQRCNGLSERGVSEVSFDAMLSDLEAVVEATGVERFILLGVSQSCAVSVAYAAKHPERVRALILYGGYAKGWRLRGDQREIARREAMSVLIRGGWGLDAPMFRQLFTSMYVPHATPEQMSWYNDLQRHSATVHDAHRLMNAIAEIDVSDLLHKVRVPTLVLHAKGDLAVPFASGGTLAEHIPDAKLVELPSDNHILLKGEAGFDQFFAEVRRFIADTLAERPASAAPEGERRFASVLTIDLVDPLQTLDSDDPESFAAVIDPCLDRVATEVAAGSGVEVLRGPADLTAVFGSEGTTEDHILAACRTALAIMDQLTRSGGMPRACIAIDSGTMIVRPHQGTAASITGPAIGQTRELARSLRRNIVVLTQRAQESAGGHIQSTRLDPGELAGLPRDLSLYALTGRNEALSRWEGRARLGLTPMVGRRAELLLLRQLLRRSAGGSGQAVGIFGQPGVGKSRLVHELVTSQEAQGFSLFQAGAQESEQATAYALIKRFVLSSLAMAHPHAEGAEARLDRWLKELALAPSCRTPLRFLLDLPGGEPEFQHLSAAKRAERIWLAVSELIDRTSESNKTICVFEDLHWGDAESLRVIQRIIDGLGTRPLIVILTYRPEFVPEWAGNRAVSQLAITGLDQDEAMELAVSLLRSRGNDQTLARHIVAATAGIPLFIEEVIRSLAHKSGGHIDATTIKIPATVQSVIAVRIGRLGEEAKHVLTLAAVIGPSVPITSLRAMLPDMAEDKLDGIVERLCQADFLYEAKRSPSRVLAFRHVLIQRVAYAALTQKTRVQFHARFMALLEREYQPESGEHAELIAEHAERAGLSDKAASYLLASAKRALRRAANRSASDFVMRGLAAVGQIVDPHLRDRLELEFRKVQGVALMASEGWGSQKVLAAFRRAEELCAGLNDPRELFAALRGLGQYYMISGQPKEAQAIAARCSRIAASPDDALQIETSHMFWTNGLFMGDYGCVIEHARHGAALYRPETHHPLTFQYSGHDPGVCCRLFGGLAHALKGDLEEGERSLTEADAIAERLEHPLTTALSYWARSFFAILRDDAAAALRWGELEVALCEQQALPLLAAQGMFQVGWGLFHMGQHKEGLQRMRRGVEDIKATGAEMGLPYYLALLAEALGKTGNVPEALTFIDRARESARSNGAELQAPEMLRIKAELLGSTGRASAREQEHLLSAAINLARRQQAGLSELRCRSALDRLALDSRAQRRVD
jgi:pimeloyl-ACP methyl ester carboxylesterase/predicted ATPase